VLWIFPIFAFEDKKHSFASLQSPYAARCLKGYQEPPENIMKIKTLVYSLLIAAAVLVSCKENSGPKVDRDASPLNQIEALSNDISSNGDEWTKENWDDAADLLENALRNLPAQLTSDEETIVSSAISRMKVYGERHRRKAEGLLDAIRKYSPEEKEKEPAKAETPKEKTPAPAPAQTQTQTVAPPPIPGLLPAHVIREGGYTNVRQGPGSNYAIVNKVKDGSPIYYTVYNANWHVVYDTNGTQLGYMHTSKVIPTAAAPAAAPRSTGVVTGTEYDWLSQRYMTENDIINYGSASLRILRNSIYARHGRTFKDAGLRQFFNSQPWYNGYRSEIPANELNKFEKYNIQFIQKYE
jgi:hypothetical protein